MDGMGCTKQINFIGCACRIKEQSPKLSADDMLWADEPAEHRYDILRQSSVQELAISTCSSSDIVLLVQGFGFAAVWLCLYESTGFGVILSAHSGNPRCGVPEPELGCTENQGWGGSLPCRSSVSFHLEGKLIFAPMFPRWDYLERSLLPLSHLENSSEQDFYMDWIPRTPLL